MSSANDLSRQALAFLDRQRLPSTPANYRLAYGGHDGRPAGLPAALRGVTDRGARLTQAAADALGARFFGAPPHGAPSSWSAASDTIRHHTLRLSDIAAAATKATGELNRDLSLRLPGFAAAAELERLAIDMLAMSRATEARLAETDAELKALREQLDAAQGDAERDALTGLPNRRGIDSHLAGFVPGAGGATIAICDIDRFKGYNDRYGHAVGDRVLRTVAASLAGSLAEHFVARWGGEEFVVVAQVPPREGVALIERAKADLAERHFRLRETDEPMGRITFSAGVAALAGGSAAADAAAALERADALLYEAKRRGRDRVLGEPASVPAG